MQVYNLKTDAKGKELTVHGSNDFPFAYYDERFSEFMCGEVPWHWHDEVEIVLVVEGRTTLECIEETIVVEQGEMVFVNSGVLHKFTNAGDADCRILNVVFHPCLISGSSHNRLYQKYVYPVINNSDLSYYVFSPECHWHTQGIATLNDVFKASQTIASGFELDVHASLLSFWALFCKNAPTILSTVQVSSVHEQRIHIALNFIHQHFSEPLTVLDISQATNISESECYRLFKSTLKCTPNGYLTQYRLQQSASYLLKSDSPITEISTAVGFNCSAYFSKTFKKIYGQTPKSFRSQQRAQ